MQDSYGDGWQGNGIAVNIDGTITYATLCDGSWGGATVSGCVSGGGSGSITIDVPVGTQSLTWELTADSYPSERSFQIYSPSGTLLYSASGASAGTLDITNEVCSYSDVSATDNCDSDVTITYADTTVDGVGNNSVITRVWTATDDNGNEATHTQTITVTDSTAPTVVTQDITVSLDENGAATITAADIENGSTDNCSTSLTTSLDITSFDCTNLGDNTVTLSVTDENGNTSTATATVTVVDEIAPTVVTQDITVSLDENGEATITCLLYTSPSPRD